MRIAVASDHHGWKLKLRVLDTIGADTRPQYELADLGPGTDAVCDYPDFASQVAGRVSRNEADRGILICRNGIGMAIMANKFAGVRAVVVRTPFEAEMSRRHNDANVLCLPEFTPQIELVLETWFDTEFEAITASQSSRHARRLQKIHEFER